MMMFIHISARDQSTHHSAFHPCRQKDHPFLLPLARPLMLTLRFTAGVGVGFSGACGPPLVWRARKPYPVYSCRRPPSLPALPASSGGAPPCLSTVFRFWVLACALTGRRLLFSFLLVSSFSGFKSRRSKGARPHVLHQVTT